MKILHRYIGRSIIGFTAVVGLLVFGLVLLFTFVGELGSVGKGTYGVMQALMYVLMIIPLQFYQVFPIVGLIGSIMALGMFASRSELTVMRAAGFSIAQVTVAVLTAALLLVAIVTLLGETVAPKLAYAAANYKQVQRYGGQSIATSTGTWIREKDSYIHVGKIVSNHHLQNVTRYEFDNSQNLLAETYIQRAAYEHHHWKLYGVSQSRFTAQGVQVQTWEHKPANFRLMPEVFAVAQLQPMGMTMHNLHRYIKFQKRNGSDATSFSFNFWQRIFQPITTSVMMLLAIPFIFGSLRSVTMGLRIVMGIVVGGGFYLLNQFLGPFSMVYQVPPFLAASLPTVLFAAVGCIMMSRRR